MKAPRVFPYLTLRGSTAPSRFPTSVIILRYHIRIWKVARMVTATPHLKLSHSKMKVFLGHAWEFLSVTIREKEGKESADKKSQ